MKQSEKLYQTISNKKMREAKGTKEFWNNRVRKYGHTGWSDSFIYAYDQQARLLAIENILNSLPDCNNSLALDFGTGSGDFANLLSKYFEKVIAFDISDAVVEIAKEKYGKVENIQFYSGNHIEEIGIPNNTVDLILSVTVLDHITDDSELIKTISKFQNILRRGSIIIALEYALDYKKSKTSYQRFMKLGEWQSIFLSCGFYLNKYYNFYHPIECPCDSYLSYETNIKVRALKIISHLISHKWVNKYLTKLASEHLQRKNEFFWENNKKQSPIKIMIFKKLK